MQNELSGLGGYASLMKTQKNPYERDIATTQNVINSMPQGNGVTGLEGLAKIPLLYQQGVDTANAKQFDEQKAIDEQKQLEGTAAYQRQKDAVEQKNKTVQQYLELAKTDKDAANTFAQTDPIMKSTALSGVTLKDKMDKNGWLSFDSLNEDGTKKIQYQFNIAGMDAASKKLKEQGVMNPTIDQIAQNMPTGYVMRAEGAAKPATDENFSLSDGYGGGEHATYKINKKTGETEVIGKAPIKVASGGDGWSEKEDLKFYKQKAAEVRSLETKAAAGFKGQLIIDGVVRSFDGSKESQDALKEEADKRILELTGNPTYQPLVQRHDPQWLKQKPTIQGDSSKHMPLTAQPSGVEKTVGGTTYFKGRDGNWYSK
jgi:hypothetical protein